MSEQTPKFSITLDGPNMRKVKVGEELRVPGVIYQKVGDGPMMEPLGTFTPPTEPADPVPVLYMPPIEAGDRKALAENLNVIVGGARGYGKSRINHVGVPSPMRLAGMIGWRRRLAKAWKLQWKGTYNQGRTWPKTKHCKQRL